MVAIFLVPIKDFQIINHMNDIILFGATAALFTFYVKRVSACGTAMSEKGATTCDALKNSAFVFVKPHANTPAVQKLVRDNLLAAGCTILSEVDIDGKTIDEQKLIDQHYYAIGTTKRSWRCLLIEFLNFYRFKRAFLE